MSWITRMAASFLLRQTASAAGSASVKHQPRSATKLNSGRRPAGLVCWSPELMARVTDRMTGERDVAGDGFRLAIGRLNDEPTIVLRSDQSTPLPKHLRALWEGHRPRLVLLLGVATSSRIPLGDLVLANKVTDGTGKQLTLDVRTPSLPGVHVGTVSGESEDDEAMAHTPGLALLLRTCGELELPTLALLRVVAAESLQQDQISPNLARQTGRWIGKLTKRQGGIGRWWSEHNAENDAIERQIDLAMQFIVA